MAKGMGAKKRLGIMQGRGADECFLCHDEDAGLSPCGTCGDLLCRDCKIDHNCGEEKKPEIKNKK